MWENELGKTTLYRQFLARSSFLNLSSGFPRPRDGGFRGLELFARNRRDFVYDFLPWRRRTSTPFHREFGDCLVQGSSRLNYLQAAREFRRLRLQSRYWLVWPAKAGLGAPNRLSAGQSQKALTPEASAFPMSDHLRPERLSPG